MKDRFNAWWGTSEWSQLADSQKLQSLARAAWDAGSHDALRVALAVRRTVLAVVTVFCALFAVWIWENMHAGGNADALYAQIRLVQIATAVALICGAAFALSFSKRRR